MQFRKDAVVRTSTGSRVGTVDRVVIEPGSKKVTHLVVKKGILFTKDKVLPVDRAAKTAEDEVILKPGAEDAADLPDFEEAYYIPADEPISAGDQTPTAYAPPITWYHRHPGTAWWGGLGAYPGYAKPFVLAARRNLPDGNIPLEEGAEVMDSEGDRIGKVKSVYVEPEGNHVTHLLVESGVLSRHGRIIPSRWIRSVAEDAVRLTIDKGFFNRLPEPGQTH
jgi:uncharacterized protein YrrD